MKAVGKHGDNLRNKNDNRSRWTPNYTSSLQREASLSEPRVTGCWNSFSPTPTTYTLSTWEQGAKGPKRRQGLAAGELWWGPSCKHLLCLVSCVCATSFCLWMLSRCALAPFPSLSYTHIQSQGKAEVQLCRFLDQSVCLCLSDGGNTFVPWLWSLIKNERFFFFLNLFLKNDVIHGWLNEIDVFRVKWAFLPVGSHL